jgi:simple sugar transport system permease protein
MKKLIDTIGLSRLILSILFLALLFLLAPLSINVPLTLGDIITRFGMNGLLVLAMMISVYCGAGLNFALPLGVICGLLGGSIAVEVNATGLPGFLLALAIGVPFALAVGWVYGRMLNKVRGSEMAVGNYMGFCFVYLFCVLWLVLPYRNPLIIWPVGGKGLRTTLTLDGFFPRILDNFLSIDSASLGFLQRQSAWRGFSFPTGLILVFAGACFLMWIFTKTKYGIVLRIGGAYPRFSKSLGISNDRSRIVGSMASMTLAAIGINVYSQSYGFYQFYTAPLRMAFPAIAALLIGGATVRKASISNAILGTLIYVGLLAMGTPITNVLMKGGSLSEIVRLIVQNGVILYALTKTVERGK